MMKIPAVRQVALDRRLLRLACEFVGGNPIPFRATLFDKAPRANWLVVWHQDTVLPLTRRVDYAEWGPWTIKAGALHAGAPASALEQIVAIRIHLDDSTPANGPLRVLPNSHSLGVLSHEQIEQHAARMPVVECIASMGGVVAMRPLVVHASSKSRDAAPRRVLHIEYAAHSDLGEGVELMVV
jgi:hypothetical protein